MATTQKIATQQTTPSSALKQRRLTFCVEGNISVGKSTMLRRVVGENEALRDIVEIIPEPVEKWQNCAHDSVGGSVRDRSWDLMLDREENKNESTNILEAFYKDPQRHAYTFQTYVFITRVLQGYNTATGSKPFRLMERSVFSDQMIFVRAVHESKWMSDLELNLYKSWYDPVVSQIPGMIPDGFIYLRASPETCFARMNSRNRSEESGVSLEYLEQLHGNHERWLMPPSDNGSQSCRRAPLPSLTTKSAITVPEEIRGSVRFVDGAHTHAAIHRLPVLVLDCDEDIDFDSSNDPHSDRLTEQVAAYFEYVRRLNDELELRQRNDDDAAVVDSDSASVYRQDILPPILSPDSKETKTMMAIYKAEAERRGHSYK